MPKIVFLLASSLVLISALAVLFLTGALNQFGTDEIHELDNGIETEPDPDIDHSSGKETAQTPAGESLKPYPGSKMKHDVQIRVDGSIEEGKGEEWWILD